MCLLYSKFIGVKFKVYVSDEDLWNDDRVDSFVQLLQLTPALNADTANWINITMLGLRRKRKTRCDHYKVPLTVVHILIGSHVDSSPFIWL